jgi:peptide deformylase
MMSILKIRKLGDPILKKKCDPVKVVSPEIKKLAADMLETMYAAPGVGLAASQVGVPVRMCVIDIKPEGKRSPIVLINPKITVKNGKVVEEEGCLSLPGINAEVVRFCDITVEAVNENGFPITVTGIDILARAMQHEIDHLEGKVFLDRLGWWTRRKLMKEIKKKRKLEGW